MPNKFDTRQSINRSLLRQIGSKADHDTDSYNELDNLLSGINLELTPPFRLLPNDAGNDRVVLVGENIISNSETGRRHSAAPISGSLPELSGGGTITFPATSGSITVSPSSISAPTITIGNSEFVKVLVEIDSNGDLIVTPGTAAASESAAVLPSPASGLYPIGYIVVSSDGSGNIDNIQEADLIQFQGAASGGGSGSGNILLERLRERFIDSSYEFVTPVIFQESQEDLTDSGNTSASYSLTDQAYNFSNGEASVFQITRDSSLTFTDPPSAAEKIAQPFTLASETRVSKIAIDLIKNASPTGKLFIYITTDSSSEPSSDPDDIVAVSETVINIEDDLTTSFQTIDFTFKTDTTLAAGDYWIVVYTEGSYIEGFAANSSNYVSAGMDSTGTDALKLSDLGWASASADLACTLYSAGDSFQSIQMLDTEFLDEDRNISRAELISYWNLDNIDASAVYEVSKAGGLDDSGYAIRGTDAAASTENQSSSDIPAQVFVSEKFGVLREARMPLAKASTNSGLVYAHIYNVDADSNEPTTILATSEPFYFNSLNTTTPREETFRFTSGVEIEGGKMYALAVSHNASANLILGITSGVTPYFSRHRSTDSGSSWSTATEQFGPFGVLVDASSWENISAERIGSTDTYRGFTELDSRSKLTEDKVTSLTNATLPLNASTPALAMALTAFTAPQFLRSISLRLERYTNPSGIVTIGLLKDDGGSPSTDFDNDLIVSSTFESANITQDYNNFYFDTIVPAGTYYIVLIGSDDYISNVGSGQVRWEREDTSTGAYTFNGSVWSSDTRHFVFQIYTHDLDLRYRITARTADSQLLGSGIFYAYQPPVVTGNLDLDKAVFSGDLDQTDFVMTRFKPNPDLLVIYELGTGKAYRYGDFEINGDTVIFPSGTFSDPGNVIELIFDQNRGGAFDNSDTNAQLLADNHLGSINSSLDRSSPGRGILLRRSDGQLVEIAIDETNSIIISEVS